MLMVNRLLNSVTRDSKQSADRIRSGFSRWLQATAISLATVGALMANAGTAHAASYSPGEGAGSAFCASQGTTNIDSFDNVYACANYNINDKFGYQCTELSNRFEWAVYGKMPQTGVAGRDLVSTLHTQDGIAIDSNGQGHLPAPGAVISMWGGPGTDPVGHTAVVTGVNVNTSTGFGSISTMGENDTPTGVNKITLDGWNNWHINSGYYYYTSFQWTIQSPSADLWFVKTIHTGSGHVEVHSATAASGYTNGTHATTWFSSADANNGTWQMVGQDLFFIKELKTGSEHVEVHSATAASGYKSGIHAVTRFSPADAFNGIWEIEGQDLYFIKIRNTGSGHVEVHSATAASGYSSGIDAATWFSPSDAYNGVWQMVGQDLYFIKTRYTGTGHVEVHSAMSAAGYRSGMHATTWFSPADATNGTWQMVGQDLFFAKEIKTGSGHVEVHSATAGTGYGSGIHAATWFSSADAYNGAWQVGDRS